MSVTAAAAAITDHTRWVDDFPSPGIRFADLTPTLADATTFRTIVEAIAETAPADVDLVAGVDARGFLFGAAAAAIMDTGVLAVRKSGKLPPPVRSCSYTLEYGSGTLEIPLELDLAGRKALVVDDVLATGGTLWATKELLTKADVEVVGITVAIELAELRGRDRLAPSRVSALLAL